MDNPYRTTDKLTRFGPKFAQIKTIESDPYKSQYLFSGTND